MIVWWAMFRLNADVKIIMYVVWNFMWVTNKISFRQLKRFQLQLEADKFASEYIAKFNNPVIQLCMTTIAVVCQIQSNLTIWIECYII